MSSGEQAGQHELVATVARYRVITRTVAAQVVGTEAKADKLLARLTKQGMLVASRRLPGNRSIYQLGRHGAAAAGVAETRTRVHGPQATLKHLSILLHCFGDGQTVRMELDEVAAVGMTPSPSLVYCIARANKVACVFACYTPAEATPAETGVRRLWRMYQALHDSEANRPFIRDGRLGLCVLVHSSQRRRVFMDAVRSVYGNQGPLTKRLRVRVDEVPGLEKYLGGGPSTRGGDAERGLWDEDAGEERE